MKKQLVVARYKEDISWIQKIKDLDYEIIIYNKDEGENLLPNVGRESHTYLTHIIRNYDNLADFTVFVQGNPIPHAPNFLDQLRNQQPTDLCFFGFEPNGPAGISGIINCDVNGQPHGIIDSRFIPVGKHYEWITLEKSPQVFVSIAGAQFGVSKRNILRRSKLFYQRAIKTVDYHNSPIEGHCFERSWGAIFGLKTNMKVNMIRYQDAKNIDPQIYLSAYLKNEEIILSGELGNYAKD